MLVGRGTAGMAISPKAGRTAQTARRPRAGRALEAMHDKLGAGNYSVQPSSVVEECGIAQRQDQPPPR